MRIEARAGHPHIDALVFDWGDVVSRSIVESLVPKFCERYGCDRDRLVKAYVAAADPYERGAIPTEEFVRIFLDGLGYEGPADIDEVMAFPIRAWAEPEPAMVALVRSLRGPYKTALLSNNIKDVVDAIAERLDLDELFDTVVLSYEEGVRKPEAEIYTRCLERLGVPADRAVFIDNYDVMCRGAEAVGMKAIHFTGYERLVQELERLGVVEVVG